MFPRRLDNKKRPNTNEEHNEINKNNAVSLASKAGAKTSPTAKKARVVPSRYLSQPKFESCENSLRKDTPKTTKPSTPDILTRQDKQKLRFPSEEKHLLAARALQWQFLNISSQLDFEKQKIIVQNQLNLAAEKIMELSQEQDKFYLELEEIREKSVLHSLLLQQKPFLETLVEVLPSFEATLAKLSGKLFDAASILPMQRVDLGNLGFLFLIYFLTLSERLVSGMQKTEESVSDFLEKNISQSDEILKLKDVCTQVVSLIKQEYAEMQECFTLYQELESLQGKENVDICHKNLESCLRESDS